MQASLHGASALLPQLLGASYPCSPHAHDNDGNTALHHASAAGELKCVRLLLQAGASPHAVNAYAWTPIAYSRTKDAKIYFEELVAEIERRKDDSRREEVAAQQRVLRAKAGMAGGVRLVTQAESEGGAAGGGGVPSNSGGGISPSAGVGLGNNITSTTSSTGTPFPVRNSPREEHRRLMDALPPLRTSVDQAREFNNSVAANNASVASTAGSIHKQMPPPPPPALDKPLPPPGGVSAEQRSAGSGWSPTTVSSSAGGRPMTPKGAGGSGTPTFGRGEWVGGGFGPVRSRE